jgi:hypothetical protein
VEVTNDEARMSTMSVSYRLSAFSQTLEATTDKLMADG